LSLERFVARQPIFAERQNVVGYELLFRASLDNFFGLHDADLASRAVADHLFLMGVEVLVGKHRAFINFTRDLLVNDFGLLLPKQTVVVEVLESVVPDDQVIAACRRLKRAGYQIAFDDLVKVDGVEPLLELADIFKVDFGQTSPAQRQEWVDRYRPYGIRMLAEKVETRADFEAARGWGYHLFQGFFFCRPEMLARRDIPAFKLNYLRVLQLVNEPELRIEQMEQALKMEASLSYRLLRYLNSPIFGFRMQINSIRHALMLLGERQIYKWVSMVALVALADDKPSELVVACLVRGRFCELLASPAGIRRRSTDLFLLGLLSLLDVILGRPMDEILAELPVSDDVKAALLRQGGCLQALYDAVLAYESGDWERFSELALQMKLNENVVPALHLRAVEWANSVFPSL